MIVILKICLPNQIGKISLIYCRPNLQLRVFWKSVNLAKEKFQRGNVLLTGATGYLGSFVLKYLLEETKVMLDRITRKHSPNQIDYFTFKFFRQQFTA